jgi:surfactin synthase thioesterase subunit|tara:strand:+ start:1784 stop:2293 length:510 start_codon:yes stop_codon:yes gene_type:complete
MALHVVFSHGQESGPWGTKIKMMSDLAFSIGCEVKSVDYQGIEAADDRVLKLIDECSNINDPICLVGSSMGGFVASAAAKDVEAVGLFVLAPAYFMDGFEYSPFEVANIPTEIVHGWHDDIVPVENSIRFAQQNHSKIHIVNGDHRLADNIKDINIYLEFFLNQFILAT